MRIRDEYLHGSDQTGVVKKIEVTTGTGDNANKSVIKYTKADSTDSVVEVPIGDLTGKAESASKLDNTSVIGSKINPVYFTEKGVPSACTYSLNATVPVGIKNEILYYREANTLDTQSYTTLTSNLDIFTAATENAAGKKGLVPAPTANQLGTRNFFLRADGVWKIIENKPAAFGGTSTSLVTTGEKYNWNSAYNWYKQMTSGDTDGIINKWKEVEAFLANYGDSTTLAAELAKLVTLSTDQTITGIKTFSEVINGSITGNAGTADKLKNTITINGVSFDGSTDITITAAPNSHSHGNITNEGTIGTDANKPIITTTNGVLTTGTFGTTANTFCEGNDSRLSDARKNPNALTLGVLNSSGEVVGEDTLYDGSSVVSFKVKAGQGITLSQDTKGEVVIANGDHNTDTKVRLTETDGTATDRYIPFSTTETSISSGSTYELYYQSDYKYNPGTKLFSVPNISISGTSNLGIISSGVWQGSPIANNYIANPKITINGSSVTLGGSIIVTATAAGGNADTVGGYSPSDFLLRTEHETFKSVIATALTDLDNRKMEVSDAQGYGQLDLWHNGASQVSATLQSTTYNETLTVKAGSGIDFSENNSIANNDSWTISAIPYNCAITLNANSAKALIKDNWSIDDQSVYLTSNGAYSGTSLAAGTYTIWIEDRASDSGTPNYYSGIFTCAGNAAAGRLDEIALHSSMATSADTNAPTRIFVATQISNTSGKHVLRFCSQDSSITNHYLTVKVNRII